jgi:hypothetical protein
MLFDNLNEIIREVRFKNLDLSVVGSGMQVSRRKRMEVQDRLPAVDRSLLEKQWRYPISLQHEHLLWR